MRDTYLEVTAQDFKMCSPSLEKQLVQLGSMRDVEVIDIERLDPERGNMSITRVKKKQKI